MLVAIALIVYIVLDIAIDSPRNLISLGGLFTFIAIFYITSTSPSKVSKYNVGPKGMRKSVFGISD